MKNFTIWAVIVSVVLVSFSGAWAGDEIIVKPHAARRFAVLPDGVRFPEGITANPKTEEIYVGTFDFGPNSPTNFCGSIKMVSLSPSETLVGRRSWDFDLAVGTRRFTSLTWAPSWEERQRFNV